MLHMTQISLKNRNSLTGGPKNEDVLWAIKGDRFAGGASFFEEKKRILHPFGEVRSKHTKAQGTRAKQKSSHRTLLVTPEGQTTLMAQLRCASPPLGGPRYPLGQDGNANKAFKPLSFGKKHKSAGRNASGSITIAHRGGGAKRLQRRIDFRRRFVPLNDRPKGVLGERSTFIYYERSKRQSLRTTSLLSLPLKDVEVQNLREKTAKLFSRPGGRGLALNRQCNMPKQLKGDAPCIGRVERIEYDPNRSSRIALVRWDFNHSVWNSATQKLQHQSPRTPLGEAFTYILASADLKVGDKIRNLPHTYRLKHETTTLASPKNLNGPRATYDTLFQQVGNCMPLSQIPIGTLIHNLEWHPGQGGKLVRAAGTFARLVQKVDTTYQSIVRLPSGVTKLLDSRCRATIGVVSNLANNTIRLTKAGQTRWLGQRPTVRGVAMNPIDHPHGGGEGRTKGGRPSVSPWGKPTKGGFKTVIKKRHK